MPQKPEAPKETWFQKNPKKTMALFFGVALLLIVFTAEKILQFYNHHHGIYLETEPRCIRLREYRPLSRIMLPFPTAHLPFTDNVFTKKYPIRADSNGFIMPSRKYARPDLSIVFLGGSTTECMFVDEENRFPYLVGQILEQDTGQKINSYNGAMAGNNSLNSIDILINKVIPLKPRIVVFMENINDLSTLLYEGTYWNQNTSRSPIETLKKSKLLGKLLKETLIPNLNYTYRNLKSALVHGQEDEFAAARGKKVKVDKPKLTHEFTMNLQTIIDICKVRGIIPVLMTQGNRITANPDPVVRTYVERFNKKESISYPDFKDIYDAFNATIRRVGQKNQVLVIDLAAAVPPNKTYFYDMVQFNDAGSKYAAQVIAAKLKSLITP